MVDNSNPTNQFHPYQPSDATPQAEARSTGLGSILERVGIDNSALRSVRDSLRNVDARQAVNRARGVAQKNPGAVLGGLAALVIGAGLMRRRT
jgi:hypothetical protein